MAARSAGGDLQSQLNVLSRLGVVGDLTDGQLLQRCRSTHDGGGQAAFTALVERHGPMVLGVCREILGDSHDAEDAFQATFLILLRKAGSVRNVDSVASWLHGVAFRVGQRAKADAFRRKAHERRTAEIRALRNDREPSRPESWPELHEEIARLPLRYREPIVLCCLLGLTTDVAAQRLRCPQGTILSRLSRGRERLRARLTLRGLAPAIGLLSIAFPSEAALVRVPGPLLGATVELATGILAQPALVRLVPASVASLTKGVLRAMLFTKLAAATLVALALATLVVGAEAALSIQETKPGGRGARTQKAAPPRATAVEETPGTEKLAGSSAAIIVSLPPRGELHQLLRRAASEGVALAKAKPVPSSWTLVTIANAQAKAGDSDGARDTFAAAAKKAEGGFGGAPNFRNLWLVGNYQVDCGFKEDARLTLQQAVKALPGVVGDFSKDSWTINTLAEAAQDQSRIGAVDDARKTVELLLEFSKKFFESSEIRNARDVVAQHIAAALAAVGDFDAAFARSDGVQNAGNVLGEIADAASKCLDREAARRFVREAAERLAKIDSADQTYMGLGDLAQAQARIGDVEAAKRSAKAIGDGPSRVSYDMTDGQPYALLRVAAVQHQAGDITAARETLREAFNSVRDHPKMRGRDGRLRQITAGQIANSDIGGALQSVGAMSGNRSQSLALVARAQAAAGNEAAARATFARALIDAGLSVKNPPAPNPDLANVPGIRHNMPAAEQMNLAEIQAMAGDVPAALKTVRSIDDEHYPRFALRAVVSARATAGDVAGALRICLDESKTPEERDAALEGLGRGVGTHLSLRSLDPRAE